MPLSDHLNFTAALEGKRSVGERANLLEGGLLQALSRPRPFSLKTCNGLVLLLLFAAVVWFWQALTLLYRLSQEQEHYSHVVLIPLLSLYSFYQNRKTIFASEEWSPWLGSIMLAVGISWSWFAMQDAASGHVTMIASSMVATLWGVFVLCYGVKSCRIYAFGLLVLLWMIPLPPVVLHAIIQFLQQMSAEAADVLFVMLGVPVFREGFTFSLTNFTVHVAEECSGIRSTLSLVITSFVAGHFFLRSLWAKFGIVAFIIPLAILKNAFRIVGLSLLANYVDPTFITDSALHRSGGIPLFLLSLVVLFSLVWLLRKFENRYGYCLTDCVLGCDHRALPKRM